MPIAYRVPAVAVPYLKCFNRVNPDAPIEKMVARINLIAGRVPHQLIRVVIPALSKAKNQHVGMVATAALAQREEALTLH